MKILLSICLFFTPGWRLTNEGPEKVELQMGESEVIRSNYLLPRIFAKDSAGYYALTKTPRYGIAHYDNNLNIKASKYIKLNDGFTEREIVSLIHFHDSLYFFFYTEQFRSRTLFVQKISTDNLIQEDTPKEIMSIRFARGWKPTFNAILSRDRSTLLVYSSRIVPGVSQCMLNMIVYGSGLERQWSKDIKYSFERVPRHDQNFTVDAKGNVFMIDLFNTPLFPGINGNANKYLLLSVTQNGEHSKTSYIGLQDKYIKSISIEPENNGYVLCSGFFSDDQMRGTVKGLFYYKINGMTGLIHDEKIYDQESINIQNSKKQAFKDNNKLFGFQINQLIHKNDGHNFLVAEQIFEDRYRKYSSIVTFIFTEQGTLGNINHIEKTQLFNPGKNSVTRQNEYIYPAVDEVVSFPAKFGNEAGSKRNDHSKTEEWNYSSYGILAPLDKEWIAIAFNDDLKNLYHSGSSRNFIFSPGRKSYLKLIIISPEHVDVYHPYIRDKKKKPLPLPVYSYDTRSNKLIFPASKNNSTFLLMELKLLEN